MNHVPYRPQWFYTKVQIPNLADIQHEFLDFFWKVMGDQIPEKSGFYMLDNTDDTSKSLHTLVDLWGLTHKWIAVNFAVINNGNSFGGIHYDSVLGAEKYIALNIPLLNCEGSYNVWYSGQPDARVNMGTYNQLIKNIIFERNDTKDTVGTDNAYWATDTSDQLEKVECTVPMLVHVGRPHQPMVTHSKLRVLLSVRFRPELTDEEFLRITSLTA